MKTKSFALMCGIVGLAGGIFLLIAPVILLGSVATDLSNSVLSNNVTTTSTSLAVTLPTIVKIAILVLGIISLPYYKGDQRVGVAAGINMIVGGAVALVPGLGWAGGIVAIVGGSLFLTKLKNFKNQ